MHQIDGSYVHSYLVINIATDQPITHIKHLPPNHQRTFVHEYTHFLQNIAGGFGMSQIWNTFDRSRQLISWLQKSNETVIRIPLKGDIVEKQEIYFKALKAIQGDYALPEFMNDSLASIKSLKFLIDNRYEKMKPDSKFHFINLKIEDLEGAVCDYSFGELAVSETMAYLMEKKFFGPSPIANFPYHSGRFLGKYLKTNITENDEFLFALCDVALLTHYPGRMFYMILLDMIQKDFKPSDSREIINYGLDYMKKNNWNVISDFENAKNGAIHALRELFQHEILKPTQQWFEYILESGFVSRKNNPYFLLELFKQPIVFEGWWENVMAQFGTPQIYNSKQEPSFRAPLELQELEPLIQPIWLSTIQQIHHTLLGGRRRCTLYDVCDRSKNGLKTDERCHYAPWVRASDQLTCAYGSLWVNYGLADKIVL